MPIEIRELHIKVTVNQPPVEGGGAQAAPAESTKAKPDKEGMVSHIVEEVLTVLNNKKER